ncbi:MAG TPA: hypothetical protein VEV45_05135 [Streptosporangiaceae bacterium]|nr:hypothetical protein [Streptosporangiaceae bacterium]
MTARDFADAGQRLDLIHDAAFARYGLEPDEVAAMRKRFATWPRTAEAERDVEAGRDDLEAGG